MKSEMIDSEIREFTAWLDQFPLARSSKNIYISSVVRFLSSGTELTEEKINGYISENRRVYIRTAIQYYLKFKKLHKEIDLVKISDPQAKIQERPYHKDWVKTLDKIKALGDSHADLYWTGTLLFYTGARINEVLHLKFKNIKVGESMVIFDKTGRSVKKSDSMPLPASVMQSLYSWLSNEKGLLLEDRCLYTKYSKAIYGYNQYRSEIEDLTRKGILTEKEGLMMRKSHNFRRSWTDMVYEVSGGDVIATADARRDSDIKTTVRYLETVKREKRADETKRKFLDNLEESS